MSGKKGRPVGYRASESERKKIAESRRGKKWSEETKKKISESVKEDWKRRKKKGLK